MSELSKKQLYKKFDGKCYFCDESKYELLDLHRIHEGHKGGKYDRQNCLTVCALCHRKIHTGQIQILGKHLTTNGKYVLHYTEGETGEEKWK